MISLPMAAVLSVVDSSLLASSFFFYFNCALKFHVYSSFLESSIACLLFPQNGSE